MPKWGSFRRPASYISLAAAVWGLSACGLVVGFGRDCVDDCASTSTTGSGDSMLSNTGSDSGNGSGGASTSNTNDAGGGSNPTSDSTSMGGNGVVTSGGTGGADGSSTSMGGSDTGGSSGAGGSGGNGTGGNAGAGSGGDGAGTGGASTGGSGTGGSGTGGDGSGGQSSTGGTGNLPDPPCDVTYFGPVPESPGVAPVQLGATPSGTTRSWLIAWQDGSSIYFRTHERDDVGLGTEYEITASADAVGVPVIATGDGERAAIGWSHSASSVDLTLQSFQVVAPSFSPDTTSTPDLGGSNATVTAVASRNDSIYLLAGVHDGDGLVALFEDGAHVGSATLTGNNVHSVAPVWLDNAFRVVFVDDDGLQFATVASDASSASATVTVDSTPPDADGPEHYVRAMSFGEDIAAVWVDDGAVRAVLLDTAGGEVARVNIATGSNNRYPNLARSGSRLAVSWLEANSGELRMQRLESDFSKMENWLVVDTDVAVEVVGFSGEDYVSDTELYAAAYNTTTVELATIECSL